ncbi:MAG: hypothetical protein KAR06_03275 [Deltaproteobacteria bacterium]|nr:hypothetical protein [Deltaproteobacteria bacterium]
MKKIKCRACLKIVPVEDILEAMPEGCTWTDAKVLRKANHDLVDEKADLLNALKGMVVMFDAVSEKIDWRKSWLDANAIRLMNENLIEARRAISNEEGP